MLIFAPYFAYGAFPIPLQLYTLFDVFVNQMCEALWLTWHIFYDNWSFPRNCLLYLFKNC